MRPSALGSRNELPGGATPGSDACGDLHGSRRGQVFEHERRCRSCEPRRRASHNTPSSDRGPDLPTIEARRRGAASGDGFARRRRQWCARTTVSGGGSPGTAGTGPSATATSDARAGTSSAKKLPEKRQSLLGSRCSRRLAGDKRPGVTTVSELFQQVLCDQARSQRLGHDAQRVDRRSSISRPCAVLAACRTAADLSGWRTALRPISQRRMSLAERLDATSEVARPVGEHLQPSARSRPQRSPRPRSAGARPPWCNGEPRGSPSVCSSDRWMSERGAGVPFSGDISRKRTSTWNRDALEVWGARRTTSVTSTLTIRAIRSASPTRYWH